MKTLILFEITLNFKSKNLLSLQIVCSHSIFKFFFSSLLESYYQDADVITIVALESRTTCWLQTNYPQISSSMLITSLMGIFIDCICRTSFPCVHYRNSKIQCNGYFICSFSCSDSHLNSTDFCSRQQLCAL